MSRPKLLDAYTRESETITAVKSDYAIVAPWKDGNTKNEDRVGYFVSNDVIESGISIVKASESSKIFGVTVESPGFATNVDKTICEVSNILSPSHSYVCFSGFATVRDNGRCSVGGICKSSSDGIAIPSTSGGGYRVIRRVDSTHILIHLDPLLQVDVVENRLIISY